MEQFKTKLRSLMNLMPTVHSAEMVLAIATAIQELDATDVEDTPVFKHVLGRMRALKRHVSSVLSTRWTIPGSYSPATEDAMRMSLMGVMHTCVLSLDGGADNLNRFVDTIKFYENAHPIMQSTLPTEYIGPQQRTSSRSRSRSPARRRRERSRSPSKRRRGSSRRTSPSRARSPSRPRSPHRQRRRSPSHTRTRRSPSRGRRREDSPQRDRDSDRKRSASTPRKDTRRREDDEDAGAVKVLQAAIASDRYKRPEAYEDRKCHNCAFLGRTSGSTHHSADCKFKHEAMAKAASNLSSYAKRASTPKKV